MRRPLLALLAAVLPLLAIAPAAQGQTRGPCVPGTEGPLCHFWTGKTTFIADGDTIRVDVAGDNTSASETIRFIGVNAMELSRYSKYPDRRRGACHGLEATALIERYIRRARGRVRLSAQDPASRTGHRLRRSVSVKVGGRWQDLGRILLEQGYALWLHNGKESAWNPIYSELAERAAAAKRNLYNPFACAGAPNPEALLAVDVNWDADGTDEKNLNGEYVDVRNLGTTDVPLAGWWLRDSWIRPTGKIPGFAFPSYAVVAAGSSVRLYVGCGENRPDAPRRFFWCQDEAVFENVGGRGNPGDGGYLFDPRGNLRASMIYPCTELCSSPLQGRVRLSVEPRTPESISIANTSAEPVDLAGHVLKLHLNGYSNKFIWGYTLGAGSVLLPGETLRVFVDGSPERDTRLERFLGRGMFRLTDGGNAVSLRSTTDVLVACEAWGSARC